MRTYERFIDFVDLYFSVLLLTPFPSVFHFSKVGFARRILMIVFLTPAIRMEYAWTLWLTSFVSALSALRVSTLPSGYRCVFLHDY